MSLKKLWYLFFKYYIKTGLFFYTKKISLVGRENIPRKGAILFAVNHPNGLLDPLLVTTNTPRVTHYLVRAAIFKKPLVKKFLSTLNLMPIYRIRDGIHQLSKNEEVFKDCYQILYRESALMIFPEGSHDRRRTVRNLSKGFTRILFGTMDMHPSLPITIIPVGVTYQKSGSFPCKVAIHYGKGISANELYNPSEIKNSIDAIKKEVSEQLKKLSVHISADEHYAKTLEKLNMNNVDFTQVHQINSMIHTGNVVKKQQPFDIGIFFRTLFIINSILPWVIWKVISKKIDEVEFVDTFRFGIGISLFPLFYILQTIVVYHFFTMQMAVFYFIGSLICSLLYSKTSSTPTR